MTKFTEFDLEMAFLAGAKKANPNWDFDDTLFIAKEFTEWLKDYTTDSESKY
jgi:hypothetical protein